MLADGKRGDIDVSAAAYGQALVGATPTPFGDVRRASAPTRSPRIPYMGADTLGVLAGAARAAGAGIFVLVRTSNPGAADVEDLQLAERRHRLGARRRARRRAGGGEGTASSSDVGAVVGATAPEHVARLRELMPRAPVPAARRRRPGRARRGPRAGLRARARRRTGDGLAQRSCARTRTRRGAGGCGPREAERLRAAAWALGGG